MREMPIRNVSNENIRPPENQKILIEDIMSFKRSSYQSIFDKFQIFDDDIQFDGEMRPNNFDQLIAPNYL